MNNVSANAKSKLLARIRNRQILRVVRQLFVDDLELPDHEQNADGPTEFIMDDGSVIHFFANTEDSCVGIAEGKMPQYGDSYTSKDVTQNSFWRPRIHKPIIEARVVGLMTGINLQEERGFEFVFSNGLKVAIEYLSDENNLDTLRIKSDSSCEKGKV